MPNQEMLDRMPEVSRETLKEALGIPETTLAQHAGVLQRKLYASMHADCQERITALEAENERLRALVEEN